MSLYLVDGLILTRMHACAHREVWNVRKDHGMWSSSAGGLRKGFSAEVRLKGQEAVARPGWEESVHRNWCA